MKRLGFICLLLCLFASAHAHATEIKEVRSRNGLKAWLVEDHKLPLISVQFAFRGGVEQDPADKQGLAVMTMDLLNEGAGRYDAQSFQQQLSDHSVIMRFEASRDSLNGKLKALTEEKETAFELLRLALTRPRFDEDSFQRVRQQQLTGMRMQLGNPEWQGRYALFKYIFGDHPYGERRLGSTETINAITKEDIKKFAADHLAQNNLVISVAGDITPDELATTLDKIFGDLPKRAHLKTIKDFKWPEKQAVILLPREGTQTNILFAMPGPQTSDKDWYASDIANYILGGGGFSSRLMQEVREKRGLTYSITTGLSPMEYGGLVVGQASTDNPKTAQAWNVTLDTMRRFYQGGASEKDVQNAKDFLTGSLPLAMTSTDKIAAVLTDFQLDGRPADYINRRNDLLKDVTLQQVNDAIRRWFDPAKLTVSMVGKPESIVPTVTQELTRN